MVLSLQNQSNSFINKGPEENKRNGYHHGAVTDQNLCCEVKIVRGP